VTTQERIISPSTPDRLREYLRQNPCMALLPTGR
jgi:hypothetical protein